MHIVRSDEENMKKRNKRKEIQHKELQIPK